MYSILPAVVALQFLAYGVLVLVKKGVGRVSLSLFALCITTFFWQGTWAILFQTDDEQWIQFLIKFGYALIILLPTSLYLFLVEITGSIQDRRWVVISYWFCAGLLFFLVFTDYFISGYYSYFWGAYPKFGLLHPLHIMQTSVVVCRGLYITYLKQKTASPRERIQLRYCLVSLLIYFFAAIDYLCNYGVEFYPPGIVFISISLGLLVYANVKYDLMDLEKTFGDWLAKLAAASLVVGAYYSFFKVASLFPLVGWLPGSWPVATISIVINVAFLILLLEVYGKFDFYLKAFFRYMFFRRRGYYDVAQVKSNIASFLGREFGLTGIFYGVRNLLISYMQMSSVRIYLHASIFDRKRDGFVAWDVEEGDVRRDDVFVFPQEVQDKLKIERVIFYNELSDVGQKFMDEENAQALISVKNNTNIYCIVLVGSHESFESYTADDISLFEYLSDVLSGSLEKLSAYLQAVNAYQKAQKVNSFISLMNEYHHEIKAPIDIMKMYADRPDEIDDYDLRQCVAEQTARVDLLLEKMLRILSSEREIVLAEVQLNNIILTALKMFPVRIGEAVLELEDSLPSITGDQEDLLILFINIFKNAIEAMHDSGRHNKLFVKSCRLGESVRVEVSDLGVGISDLQLDKMWDPLVTNKDSSGTGLGLSIVKRIMEEHYGRVEVESEVGKGTTFTFTFPVRDARGIE